MRQKIQFESASKRELIFAVLARQIPNIIIASLASVFLNHSDAGIIIFVVVFFGLWVVEFLFWLRNLAWSWGYFYLVGKKLRTETILRFLRENKFPAPNDFLSSSEAYFTDIVNDDDADTDLRIKSAAILVRQNAYSQIGGMSMAIQTAITNEEALSLHAASLNRTD